MDKIGKLFLLLGLYPDFCSVNYTYDYEKQIVKATYESVRPICISGKISA
jgi:hypothetical protein